MNTIARGTRNIYNLRLFGIFGKYEPWHIKFLSNLCCKAVFGLPLTVRRDCHFDFLYIEDLPEIVAWFIEHTPKWHDYNVVHGQEYRLMELAEMVRQISGKELPVIPLSNERNLDYSADVTRLRAEMDGLHITPMKQALEELYHYYEVHRKAYQLLKAEGYITTGRRDGAVVRLQPGDVKPETMEGLRLRVCELRLAGLGRDEILTLCGDIYDKEVEGL